MKKKIFSGVVFFVFAVIMGFNVSINNSQKDSSLADLKLSNIEALAQTQADFTIDGWQCFWLYTDGITDPLSVIVTECSGCHFKFVIDARLRGNCWH